MKRFFDVVASGIGLILLSPLFIILTIWIKCDSTGSVFYRQIRVGRNNRDFQLLKFRSMRVGSDKKGLITVGGRDPRVTRSGYYIRKYVDMYTAEQRRVLAVRPGITDYASIVYMDENRLLGQSSNPDKTYVEDIMPAKIELNMRYINHPTLFEYFKLIVLTIFKIVR